MSSDVTPDVRQRLLEAWPVWDDKPGAVSTAAEMVEASKAAAEQLGIPVLVFDDALRAARRAGLDRTQALDRVLHDFE